MRKRAHANSGICYKVRTESSH